MNWTEGFTSIEGHSVYHQQWSPDTSPKARILLVHGLGEHSSRYAHVGEFFCREGYELTGFDLLGHGKTGGQRGHAESYDDYCAEVKFFLDELTARQPSVPVFLYGHSMGGLISLYYALNKETENISGIICTSPGLEPGFPIPKWKTVLGKFLYNVAPRFSMANGLPVDGISHDKTVVSAYRADPLNHPQISARMGMDLIQNGFTISRRASEITLPTLLMVGKDDYLINPNAVITFGQQANPKIVLKVWEGGFHELHNEPFKNDVLKTITDWINLNV